MDALEALNNLKSLVDQNNLPYSEYDKIKSLVLKQLVSSSESAKALDVLYRLVDEKLIDIDTFECLKTKVSYHPAPTQYRSYYQSDKPIHGKGLGVVLGLFLGPIGLILGLCLGDDDAKTGSIIGFVIDAVIGVIVGIIYGIYLATLPDEYYYFSVLTNLIN